MPGPQDLLRGLVSKNKNRFVQGDYDLDLTYIYPNLIAMGFPSEKLEGVYRNHIDDVVKFLDERHWNHYKVYNLCSERHYDAAKFHKRVAEYPFDDHHPPRIQLIEQFCNDVDLWLCEHEDNVAVIHCKAGKGRTGVMICSYMIHREKANSSQEALEFYGKVRTSDCKGVTIPSQKRYVDYYAQLRTCTEPYAERTLFLKGIKFFTLPTYTNLTPQIVIHKHNTKIYQTQPIESVRRSERELCMQFPEKIPVCGDIRITVINNPKMLKKERLFQFWFNTFFIREALKACDMNGSSKSSTNDPKLITDKTNGKTQVRATHSFTFDVTQCLVLKLTKFELDKANKDKSHKYFSPLFQVWCFFDQHSSGSQASGLTALPADTETVLADSDDDHLSDTDTDDDTDEMGQVTSV